MSPLAYLASGAVVFAFGYLVFRVIVRRDYLNRGRLSPLSSALEWAAILLWVVFAWLNRPPGWPEYGARSPAPILGWCLLVGGGAPFLWALTFGLGLGRSHGLRVDDLRQTGLYAISRNPQVVGFLIAMLGYLLLWPTARSAGSVVLIACVTHLMVRTEEEHLQDRFGKQYERYRRRVPRYLGLSPRLFGSRDRDSDSI